MNNACPICKDGISITHTVSVYTVLYCTSQAIPNNIHVCMQDTNLLEQFLSPHTGEIFEASKTGNHMLWCFS